MWRWLFDRICLKESRFATSEHRKDGQATATIVLYAKVEPGLHPDHPHVNSVTENRASTVAAPTSLGGVEPIRSGTLPPNPQDHRRAARVKKRKLRLRRFARRFAEMTPLEARLLFAVHRRTVRGLAKESSAGLQRDLHRFILSSRGQRISRGQPAPSIQKVRSWVETARQHTSVC